MKILHISPDAPFNEGWGYQENLLPKYQARLGHQVVLIASAYENGKEGLVPVPERRFFSRDGFEVIQRKTEKSRFPVIGKLFTEMDTEDLLEEFHPDFIFYHGMISLPIRQAAAYKKKYPSTVLVMDNHMDYRIGFKPDTFRAKCKALVYRTALKPVYPLVNRIYGVTPWRKTYAEEVFGAPKEKTDVLVMGADDDAIPFSNRDKIRERIRKEHRVADHELLIVSGGKLSGNKNIIALMKAVSGLQNVRLVLFGSVQEDIKEEFLSLLSGTVEWDGWIPSDRTYDYFLAADLAFFPGQHSVLWEQACACGIPCVFQDWEGMHHVDAGGNCLFLKDPDVLNIRSCIQEITGSDLYESMKKASRSLCMDAFLYSRIAVKSLETANPDLCRKGVQSDGFIL